MIEQFIRPGINYLVKDGIHEIMDDEFRNKITLFEKQYIPVKKTTRVDEIKDHESLPTNPSTYFPFEWKLRQEGLSIVKSGIEDKGKLNILEVSTFNGWLTHHLHNWGHAVVSVDYFSDEVFGLKSKFNYRNNGWLSVQCNLEDLSFFEPVFDVIVLNHAIQFFNDTNTIISQLKKLLKPNGKIIFLGLFFFMDSVSKQKEVEAYSTEHFEKHGFNIFFAPTKGFLDKADKQVFIDHKVSLYPYKCGCRANLVARFIKKRALVQFGIYENLSRSG
jgi:2-polyprenyl-3-methyl-5-hydroxy-6-metoxy-1,4-benzoquinol methylase